MTPSQRDAVEGILKVMATGYRFKSDLLLESWVYGYANGQIKGKAANILRVLTVRGVEVSDKAEKRITDCTDIEQLGAWFTETINTTTTEQVFDRAPTFNRQRFFY